MQATLDYSDRPLVMVFSSETYRAEAFLEAASRMGIELVIASDAGDAPQMLLGPRYVGVDLSDPEGGAESIARALEGRVPGGVLSLDDAAVALAGVASARLGISRNSVAGLMATRNKAALRRRLEEAGVRQPRFSIVEHPSERSLRDAGRECGFPCVVKPAELQASTGVIRADGMDSLTEATHEAFAIQKDYLGRPGPVVVEEFLPGREIGVEAVLVGGDVEVLAFIDKPEAPCGPYFPETILVTPADLAPADSTAVTNMLGRAAAALGIVDGPLHAEFREARGEYRLLEVAARTIGGLCSKALVFESETLEEVVLRRALGDMGPARCAEGYSGVVMLYPKRSGRVRAVVGVEEASSIEGVSGVDITVHVGSQVDPLPRGNRYLGFAFARADTYQDCVAALKAARAAIRFEIDGEHGCR